MLIWILVAVLAWCVVTLPLAVLVGRAIGAADRRSEPPRRSSYERVA